MFDTKLFTKISFSYDATHSVSNCLCVKVWCGVVKLTATKAM